MSLKNSHFGAKTKHISTMKVFACKPQPHTTHLLMKLATTHCSFSFLSLYFGPIMNSLANFSAHAGPAFCLIGICFTGCNDTATIALLTLAITMQGALYTGFFVNPLDIASNFSGTILGITNAFGTIPGWLAPLIAGALTQKSVSYIVLARTG